jgi:hypothetical protein
MAPKAVGARKRVNRATAPPHPSYRAAFSARRRISFSRFSN